MLRAEGISHQYTRRGGGGEAPDLPAPDMTAPDMTAPDMAVSSPSGADSPDFASSSDPDRNRAQTARRDRASGPSPFFGNTETIQSGRKEPFTALVRTNFFLPPGALALITGPSGGGKTTLLRILAGLLRPSTGAVFLDNTDLYALRDGERSRLRNRRMGYVAQRPEALPDLTVLENVMLPSLLYGTAGDVRAVALTLLSQVGLLPLRNVPAGKLSGGEVRRLAMARALVMKPEVLLADEPTADLDEESAGSVLDLLRKSADSGTAVLFSAGEEVESDLVDAVCRIEGGVVREGR